MLRRRAHHEDFAPMELATVKTTTQKRVHFADGKVYIVTLTVDSERLATRMAIKARGNKRKEATILQEAVTAVVREDTGRCSCPKIDGAVRNSHDHLPGCSLHPLMQEYQTS